MKRALTACIILIIIGVIGACSVKPLRIQYHLHKFRNAAANITFGDPTMDAKQISKNAGESSRHVMQLLTLGYLSEYTIPIESPLADAEKTTDLLLTSFFVHKVPAAAQIDTASDKTLLTVVDKLENKHWWEMIVRMNLTERCGPADLCAFRKRRFITKNV